MWRPIDYLQIAFMSNTLLNIPTLWSTNICNSTFVNPNFPWSTVVSHVMVNYSVKLAGLQCPVVQSNASLDVAVKIFYRYVNIYDQLT